MGPRASIVYLTKNGGEIFRKSLEAVYAQQVDFDYEVIAVDSGSTDGTLDILKSYPVRLYQIPPDEFNFGLTRDYGFSLAQGEILVVLSQDAVPVGTSWLHDITSPLDDDSIAVVQGMDILPGDGDNLFYWDKVGLFYHTRDCKKWMAAYDNIGVSFTSCAIRRTVWEGNPMGRIEMSEDKVFQKRMRGKGYKIFFQREAKDYHSHIYTATSLAKRCENEGLGWRNVDIEYSFMDMLKDIFKSEILFHLIRGLYTLEISRFSELLFPLIRPIFVYKGNKFSEKYVC